MDPQFLETIKCDFPGFKFTNGKKFAFRPPKTIVVGPEEPGCEFLLFHELGHAILGHKDYKLDAERLKMEALAWEKAREIAEKYNVLIDEDMIQDELDTYRDWLHTKSRCKKCGLTRYQTTDGIYHCPKCENFS